MSLLAFTAAALLAQAEPAAEPPSEPAAPSPTATPAAPGTDPAQPQMPRIRAPNPEELERQLERIRKLPPSEANDAINALMRRYPGGQVTLPEPSPTVEKPHNDGDDAATLLKLGGLSEPEQVKYVARAVFHSILAGDARSLVLLSAYPFQLEDRRLEMPDELHKEWLKNLRSKRTDLLTLYDVEVLSPAEMEKKYGKPPARLANLPWKQPKTYLAIGNLSGHAAVAVFRMHPGGRWQLVGYHD